MTAHRALHYHLQQALDAYQSPVRTNYPLHHQQVSNLEAAIYFLNLAHQQQPEHLSTLLTLATLHTFQGDIDTAIALFRQCLIRCQSTPEHRRVLTYLIAWHHYQHDHQSVAITLARLRQLSSQSAGFLDRVLGQIERILTQPIQSNAEEPLHPRTPNSHALITLGYKLQPDGTLARPLRSRLNLTKKLSLLYPTSAIVVTGGAPQQGHTEAQRMKQWLIENDVDGQRIIEEGLATSTIDNARFSLALLHQHGIRQATVISHAAHVQRSQLLFQLLQLDSNQPTITVDHCALPEPHINQRSQAKAIKRNCYIDALRAIGLPAFDCPPFVSL
ncbi:YdcF family protein [Photobacterium atrarenae]|uniref:YdcF family protein n=1 Tax=Photobacterium atrarenae TaxID=865757 RepID=A0ABY5GMM1_9GAMM|nr:YdcF family protein [Photobacterium atrarenae]UTV30359.1 YdcF family protein [Photobacterium atrarenae]